MKHVQKVALAVMLIWAMGIVMLSGAQIENLVVPVEEAQYGQMLQAKYTDGTEFHSFGYNYLQIENRAETLYGQQLRMNRNMGMMFLILLLWEIFSLCSGQKRVYLSYTQFCKFLIARYLCDLHTRQKKDGKKRAFAF